MNKTKIFADFFNTEIEKGNYEHRVAKFIIPTKIEGIYFRFWVWKKVLVLSTKNGVSFGKKDRLKLKILFGIEGRK